MRKFGAFTVAALASAALTVAPAATAVSHSGGDHANKGNHCGQGHVKHTRGIGKSCHKRDRNNHRNG
jgi:hypothetical protein